MAIIKNSLGTQFTALYHGTNKPFKRGDVILPASKAGVKPVTVAANEGSDIGYDQPSDITKHPYSDYDLAHASENAGISASYAHRAVETFGGQFHLYRVAPVNPDDVHHESEDEYSSPSGFRVIRRLNIENMNDPRLDTQMKYLDKYYEKHFGTKA